MSGFVRRILGGGETSGGPPPRAEQFDSGIFAGFFVATPEQVERWDMSGLTPPEWRAAEFKHISGVNLGTLEAILTGRRYDDIDQDELHHVIRIGGPEGPWITAVRTELRDSLARLEPDRVGRVAAAWADTDEFKMRPSDRPRPEDVAQLTALLHDLVGLARGSAEENKPMYLLMSL
jgi:hypothetical protein